MSHCTQTLKSVRGSILVPTSAVIAGSTFRIGMANVAGTWTIVIFTMQTHRQENCPGCVPLSINTFKSTNVKFKMKDERWGGDSNTALCEKSVRPVCPCSLPPHHITSTSTLYITNTNTFAFGTSTIYILGKKGFVCQTLALSPE